MLGKRFFIGAIAACLSLGLVSPGAAQTEADFIAAFSGDWQVVDDRFVADGQRCVLTLDDEAAKQPSQYTLTPTGCDADLALAQAWGIGGGQMSLFGSDDAVISRLGGNQRRMSGDTGSGYPLILERVGAPGTADLLKAALEASGCFFLGFTDKCAQKEQLAKPANETASVAVVANLNARAEARDDAEIVGVVPVNACVVTEVCVEATDGTWCRAKFQENTGWMRKLALRQNKWPIVTYVNTDSCSSETN